MKRKVINWSAVLVALSLTVFYVFGLIHNCTNNRFTVKTSEEYVRPGYESAPAEAQIAASPALTMKHTPKFPIVIGVLFIGLTVVAVWWVSTDRYYVGKGASDSGGEYLGLLYILVPTLLAGIFLFGWYSSRFANNYVTIPKARFEKMVESGAVKKKGTTTYSDPVDSLRNCFNGKKFIR